MDEQVADYEPDEGYPPDADDQAAGDHNVPIPKAGTIRKRARAAVTPAPPKKPKKPINRSKILAREKQRRALELRKGGATYDAIAQALGYADPSGARKAIERAMKKVIQEPALEVKTLQIERCNHMLLTLWPQVQAGDLGAINSAIRVMQQLDAYTGAANAQQVDVNVHVDGGVLVIDGNKDDYIAQMKRMVGVGPDGRNVPEISQTPYVDGDIIDGQVVGENEPMDVVVNVPFAQETKQQPEQNKPLSETLDEEQKQAIMDIMAPPAPTFDFGMDPEKFQK